MTEREQSVIDLYESTREGALGLAAAGLARRVLGLLKRAHKSSGMKGRDLAEELGVSEGRVSQVLNGDGNVRVATLARFLRACGYELQLEAVPVDPRARPLVEERRRRRGNERLGGALSWSPCEMEPALPVDLYRGNLERRLTNPRPVLAASVEDHSLAAAVDSCTNRWFGVSSLLGDSVHVHQRVVGSGSWAYLSYPQHWSEAKKQPNAEVGPERVSP